MLCYRIRANWSCRATALCLRTWRPANWISLTLRTSRRRNGWFAREDIVSSCWWATATHRDMTASENRYDATASAVAMKRVIKMRCIFGSLAARGVQNLSSLNNYWVSTAPGNTGNLLEFNWSSWKMAKCWRQSCDSCSPSKLVGWNSDERWSELIITCSVRDSSYIACRRNLLKVSWNVFWKSPGSPLEICLAGFVDTLNEQFTSIKSV